MSYAVPCTDINGGESYWMDFFTFSQIRQTDKSRGFDFHSISEAYLAQLSVIFLDI